MTRENVFRYCGTTRADILAGYDPMWKLMHAEVLNRTPIHGAGPHGAGTFLKVLREEEMWAARERAREVWARVRTVWVATSFHQHISVLMTCQGVLSTGPTR
jgi:hypothetical protein